MTKPSDATFDAECDCKCCQCWRTWTNELFREIGDTARQAQFDHDDAMSKILRALGEA